MKPDSLSRIRHEMADNLSGASAFDEFDQLVKFLDRVKDTARLRAKTEGGVTFLHTRTGTFFGKFIKKMTVAWPAAKQQRILARECIKSVLDKLDGSNTQINNLKKTILEDSLAVKDDAEFNLAELRNQLKILRALLKSPTKEKSDNESASELLQEANFISNDGIKNTARKQSAEYLTISEKNKNSTDLTSSSTQDLPENDFKNNLSSGKTINSGIHPETLQMTSEEVEKHINPHPTLPVEKSTFGCLKLQASVSASSINKIGDFHADAYIMPRDKKNLSFRMGTVNFPSSASSIEENGIRFYVGTHTYHDEMRPISVLQLGIEQNSDESLSVSMSKESKAQHLKQLHELYTRALTHAFTKGARQIALEPCRKGNQLLSTEEIQTLAESVSKFQEQHPETKLQVVLIRSKEYDQFIKHQGLKH